MSDDLFHLFAFIPFPKLDSHNRDIYFVRSDGYWHGRSTAFLDEATTKAQHRTWSVL